MRSVSIIGIGQTPVGELWEQSARQLAYDAISSALAEANVERADALFVGNMLSGNLLDQEHLGTLVADVCGLHGVEASQLERVNIAYEPVWSIGAGGTPATPADVEPIAATVRAALGELFGAAGSAVPILYGGSVDPKNAGTFTGLPNVDGLLVGRAGWAVESFVATFESGLAGYLGKA